MDAILIAVDGYEILVRSADEIATTADNYCAVEPSPDGAILHLIPKTSAEGQRIADWLAAT